MAKIKIHHSVIDDLKELDNSIRILAIQALERISIRGDEISKDLFGNLSMCKKITFKKQGIRIVFTTKIIEDETVVLAASKREDKYVYTLSHKRLQQIIENKCETVIEVSTCAFTTKRK
ncbi:MAG: hypothetical protein ACRCWQ_08455 [Bacilli bacterium]